jgi:hypothetical protein
VALAKCRLIILAKARNSSFGIRWLKPTAMNCDVKRIYGLLIHCPLAGSEWWFCQLAETIGMQDSFGGG